MVRAEEAALAWARDAEEIVRRGRARYNLAMNGWPSNAHGRLNGSLAILVADEILRCGFELVMLEMAQLVQARSDPIDGPSCASHVPCGGSLRNY